jgi:nitroreductase
MEDILYALEVARQAPSGANEQPWRFLVITDPELKNKLREASEKGEKYLYENVNGKFREWLLNHGLSPEKPFLEEAPILIVVIMNKSAKYARESIWLAIGYIILALEERGLNTITYTPSNTNYPLEELDVPKGFKLEAILPVGFSEDETPKESKRDLNKSVYLNNWGKSLY